MTPIDKGASTSYQRRMRQVTVFLVEDEPLIRLTLVEMLEELGQRVVAEAGSIGDAHTLAETAMFDLAILDVNVDGRTIDPIADRSLACTSLDHPP